MNSKLPELDQLRWIIKDFEDLKTTYDGLLSLRNSFHRLSLFCEQKITEKESELEKEKLLKTQEEEKARAESEQQDQTNQKQSLLPQEENLLEDIDKEPVEKAKHNIEISEEEPANEGEDEDDESMSLKDVIMTLNDFYAAKLESLFMLIENRKNSNPYSRTKNFFELI